MTIGETRQIWFFLVRSFEKIICLGDIPFRVFGQMHISQDVAGHVVCSPDIQEWVDSWMSESVFSLGRGRSSAAAWYSTVLDIEETVPDCHVHAFAADVIKSLDTVVRRMLDCVLGQPWFTCLV